MLGEGGDVNSSLESQQAQQKALMILLSLLVAGFLIAGLTPAPFSYVGRGMIALTVASPVVVLLYREFRQRKD